MAHRRKHASTAEKRKSSGGPHALQNLLNWDQIPPWQQDNEYILSGYREPTKSFRKCCQSLKYIHNETINIYSHFLGAAVFLLAPSYTYHSLYSRNPQATVADIIVFSTFFYGVATCFLLSSM